jgi:hypothetical protein
MLDPLRAKVFKSLHFGIQIVGVDVHVDASRSLAEALYEQAEVLSVQPPAVVLGVVELGQALACGRSPERQLAIVIIVAAAPANTTRQAVAGTGVSRGSSIPAIAVPIRTCSASASRSVFLPRSREMARRTA